METKIPPLIKILSAKKAIRESKKNDFWENSLRNLITDVSK